VASRIQLQQKGTADGRLGARIHCACRSPFSVLSNEHPCRSAGEEDFDRFRGSAGRFLTYAGGCFESRPADQTDVGFWREIGDRFPKSTRTAMGRLLPIE
jgi:hypothetical protein